MPLPARIAAAQPPFDPEVQGWLDRTMPSGKPPLVLFTKFFSAGLLDRGHLTLRQRELVIHRTTALCGSEYEWGVHVAAFSKHVKLTPEQLHATVHGDADAACWSDEDRLLIRLCDALHEGCTLDDALWQALRQRF